MFRKKRFRQWISVVPASLWLTGICFGATYDLQKIAMTGDDVPDVTETFRFFRSVHMFPDGSVAFAAVTTRTQSVQRNSPRGIYYAGVPGALITVAAIDDAEAWRSIGLPHSAMDSNRVKTFSFDFLQPTETSLQEVIATKPFGEPIEYLTPIDESNTVVTSELIGENEVYVGRFEWGLNGPILNEAGQMAFIASFSFEDDPDTPVKGVFQYGIGTGIRNVIFAGNSVPGIADATFYSFGHLNQAENGTIFFNAILTGDGAPSESDRALWMEKDGQFTLVLREGSPAPGFPDYSVSTVGGLSIAHLDVKGERTIVFSGVNGGGGTIRGYWTGTTSGGALSPMLLLDNYPNLNDPGIFTATDQGNVAFTYIDNNSIQLDSAGDIYFTGGGKFADDIDVGGIWKQSAVNGSLSLVLPSDFENGMYQYALLDVSDQGELLFVAKQGSVKSLWVRDQEGLFTNVISVGDMLEEREIIHFSMLSTVNTLGDHRFFDLFNSIGSFVFVAQFEDADGDIYRDEAVYIAQRAPDPTDHFIWTGEAGDDDWHRILNWDDKETDTDALFSPGDAEGTETIEIPQADVTVTDSPVHIKTITASGSLTLGQPFNIEEASTIEDLVLDSDLSIKDDLLLLGEPKLKQGTVTGEGALIFEEAANGYWVSLAQGGQDEHDIKVHMNLFGTLFHGENVVVDFKENGFLFIKEGGVYWAMSGKIAYTENNILKSITNAGTIEVAGVNGSDSFTIEAFLLNDGGVLDVVSGELILNNEGSYQGGRLMVGSGARLVFGKPVEEPFLNIGSTVTEDLIGSGEGTVLFIGNKFSIPAGKKATFDMSLISGGFEVEDGAEITGKGTLVNEGQMVFREGTLEALLENRGTLVISGSTEVVNLKLIDTSLVNKQFVSQEQVILLSRESDSAPEFSIVNEGTWNLEDDSEIASLSNGAKIKNGNSGRLRKEGAGEARVGVEFFNEGLVRVPQGTLVFDRSTTWGTHVIGTSLMQVEAGAVLRLDSSIEEGFETHAINSGVALVAGGRLEFMGDRLQFGERGRLVNGGSLISISGKDTGVSDGEIYNRVGTLVFLEDADSPRSRWDTTLRNGTKGVIELPGNFSLSMNSPRSRIINEGEFRISGSLNDLALMIPLIDSDSGVGTFTNGGFLTVSTGSRPAELKSTIEPEFRAALDGGFGTVEVENQSWVDITNPASESVARLGLGRAALLEGEWVVGYGCKVDFGDLHFVEIGTAARVILEGDPLNIATPLVGQIGGLPIVYEDFTNRGQLQIKHGNFSMVAHTFLNRGVFRFSPGRFTMVAHDGKDGLFRNEGAVYGNAEFVGGNVINAGYMAPGHSPGKITINGDFVQESDGELQMELGGSVPGEDYDQLVVNGTATLGGRLRLLFPDGAFPDGETWFMPVVATTLQGQFDEVVFDVASGRHVVEVVVTETGVMANAQILDVSTFSAWRIGVFTAEEQADEDISGLQADPDGDGLVNLLEYALDGNPKVVTHPQVVAAFGYNESGVPQEVRVDFPWANGISDVQYGLEYTGDLETWETLSFEVSGNEDIGLVSRVSLAADLPVGTGSGVFVRLVVSEI